MSRWWPLRTSHQPRCPELGQLIAYAHAVWRVTKVEDVPLDDNERQKWIDGMPDLATWNGRPFDLTVEWVGGAIPKWAKDGDWQGRAGIRVPAEAYTSWHVYEDGRWPQCSCCGEPMPCRAELEDRQVGQSLDRIARLEAIPTGACWACAEPITRRQKVVTYPGENLDLPGGQQPYFHTRDKCRPSAERYERAWVAVDPRRERILTWPRCDGILSVHADGSSECVAGHDLFGRYREPQQGCQGHLTHDHDVQKACYVEGFDMRPSQGAGVCPRGCRPENHGGTRTTRRPERRQPSDGQLSLDTNQKGKAA